MMDDRRCLTIGELTDEEILAMTTSVITSGTPYELAGIPDDTPSLWPATGPVA